MGNVVVIVVRKLKCINAKNVYVYMKIVILQEG